MLLQNIRAKIGARLSGEGEAGFTLIELLVVMLILGILAAIAIPAFFNQKGKADDASAKETLHTAQVTMQACANEENEVFTNCDQGKLHEIESAVPDEPSESLTVATDDDSFTLTAPGSGDTEWSIGYTKTGGLTYTCTPPEGSCTGNWGSNAGGGGPDTP